MVNEFDQIEVMLNTKTKLFNVPDKPKKTKKETSNDLAHDQAAGAEKQTKNIGKNTLPQKKLKKSMSKSPRRKK